MNLLNNLFKLLFSAALAFLFLCEHHVQAAAGRGVSQLLRTGGKLLPEAATGLPSSAQFRQTVPAGQSGLLPSRLPRFTAEEVGSTAIPEKPFVSRLQPGASLQENEELRKVRAEALQASRPSREFIPREEAEAPQGQVSSSQPDVAAAPAEPSAQPMLLEDMQAQLKERQQVLMLEYENLQARLESTERELAIAQEAARQPVGWGGWFQSTLLGAETPEQTVARLQEAKGSLERALHAHQQEQQQLAQRIQNLPQEVRERNAYLASLPKKMEKELQIQLDAFKGRILSNMSYLSGLPARDRKNQLQDYYDRHEKDFTNLFMRYKETDPITKGYFEQAWQAINGPAEIARIERIIKGELPLSEIAKPLEKPVEKEAWYKQFAPGSLVQKRFGQQRRQFSTLGQQPFMTIPQEISVQAQEVPVSVAKSKEKKKRPDSYVTRVREGALAPFIPVGIRNVIHREKLRELTAAGIPKGEQRKAIRAIDYDAISRGLLEKMVSGEAPRVLLPTSLPSISQPAEIAPLTGMETALVPFIAGSTALAPVAAHATGTMTVMTNKPVTEAFMADAQTGRIMPEFIVQYKPGQEGKAGELVIASRDRQLQMDLNVFNVDTLQPQLRRMLAQMVRRNEPVTVAIYPQQGRLLMQPEAAEQMSTALVPAGQAAQSSQPDIFSQLVDVLGNEETVVLRFEAHEQATPPALTSAVEPESSEQIQQPSHAESSQPRREAQTRTPVSRAEPSEPQRSYEQQRVVEHKETQPTIKRERRLAEQPRPDLSQRAEQMRRQRSATQAVEAAAARDGARLQAERSEPARDQEVAMPALTEREVQQPQATPTEQQATVQEREQRVVTQESLTEEEIAEQLERNRLEEIRLRQADREALDAVRAQAAERAQVTEQQRLQNVLRQAAQQQAPQPTSGLPAMQAGSTAPVVTGELPALTGPVQFPVQQEISSSAPEHVPAAIQPGITSAALSGEPAIVAEPEHIPEESEEARLRRARNRALHEMVQTALSRHRAAILAAMKANLPIAQNIIHDFASYSANIRDMLQVYNRHLFHCHTIRAWTNEAKTEADAVLAKIKTNIKQMLDRRGLTVDAKP